MPRHSTVIICPGSILEMSALTGAPAARAFALGFQEPMNGTAMPTAPAAPTTDVATVRNWRRPLFTPGLLKGILRLWYGSRGCVQPAAAAVRSGRNAKEFPAR